MAPELSAARDPAESAPIAPPAESESPRLHFNCGSTPAVPLGRTRNIGSGRKRFSETLSSRDCEAPTMCPSVSRIQVPVLLSPKWRSS